MRLDLPSAVRNPISLIGIAVTTAAAVVFLVLLLLEMFGQIRNPYFGLLLFVAVPAVFILGLVLIPIGVWRQHRKPAGEAAEWPVVDFGLPRTRTVVLTVFVLTCVNILIVSLAAYGAVHHMESVEFCGTTCHTPMEPEWKAYQVSAHAKVKCVDCHVGEGAEALIQSKIAGTRQLWQVITNNVHGPVPAPVHTMRPARETCQTCHWAEKGHGDVMKVVTEYSDDEENSEAKTTIQLHVGGGEHALNAGSGIHWHMNVNNTIEYIATDDKRQVIPWVKLTTRDGTVTEFAVDGVTPEKLAGGERRTMDCLDCHNRPAHTLEPTPERAVDNAMAAGLFARDLPFVRREAIAALKDEYPSKAEALAGIEARLRKFYAEQAQAKSAELAKSVAATQRLYENNVFPAMKVTWGTYPNNIGHTFFNGCFRCHDENHKAKDGRVIAQNCESCHAFP
jgi:nitrate/TMAO reductase-like tetraheme cytochrome c subunit